MKKRGRYCPVSAEARVGVGNCVAVRHPDGRWEFITETWDDPFDWSDVEVFSEDEAVRQAREDGHETAIMLLTMEV